MVNKKEENENPKLHKEMVLKNKKKVKSISENIKNNDVTLLKNKVNKTKTNKNTIHSLSKKSSINPKSAQNKKKKVLPIDESLNNNVEIVPIKKKKRKCRIFFKIALIIVTLLSIVSICMIKYYIDKEKEKNNINNKREYLINEIKSHYGNYVKVIKKTPLLSIDKNNYKEIGIIYENTELVLEKIEINENTKYFYSTSLNAYLDYQNVVPIETLTECSERYKQYIVFNKNIITKEVFTLYDGNNKVYTFNNSMIFPIIIDNYDGKYYIEYNNRMLNIMESDVQEVINNNNTKLNNAKRITTLCYHRVYDANEKCNDLYICKKKSNFDKEIGYLKDNGYLSLTMDEMYLYLTGKIRIPTKSILITLDDGYLVKSAIDILEKYQMYATSFIKTSSFEDLSGFKSEYLELHSHTNNMHTPNKCPREATYQQGGGILCLSKELVLTDLKKSREKLNGAIAMAYPFYDYNERAKKLVKEAGFKLAFIGAWNNYGRSYPGIDLYQVPRMTIWDTTSFADFISYVRN